MVWGLGFRFFLEGWGWGLAAQGEQRHTIRIKSCLKVLG